MLINIIVVRIGIAIQKMLHIEIRIEIIFISCNQISLQHVFDAYPLLWID
jgi:hypothetical protein